MRTIKKFIIPQLFLFIVFLSGCTISSMSASEPISSVSTLKITQDSDNISLQESNTQTSSENDTISSRVQSYIANFSKENPDFKVLDYIYGNDENAPILLAVIAQNLQNNTSSTLFIMDENGVGKVVLAANCQALYRNQDGLTLNKNTIKLSLTLQYPFEEHLSTEGITTNITEEIHDFEITVTQEKVQNATNTVYSSKETIRLNEQD